MTSWFESNQTKSVVLYTIVVSGTTWAVFNVLLDDRKLASAKAEVDQYKAKTEVLESQISQLRDENQKYLSWLSDSPGTIPYLESELSKARDLAASKQAASPSVEPNMSTPNGRTATLTMGQSFIDPITGATVGVGRFYPDFTVDLTITFPDGKTQPHPKSKAGEVWHFVYESATYRVTLSRSDWYTNQATISIQEST